MPSSAGILIPNFSTYIKSIRNKGTPVESSIENLIALLKRHQIHGSKACALATAYLLRRVAETSRTLEIADLINRVQLVGQQIIAAQPKELAIGNIVRRVLGVIREEREEKDKETRKHSDAGTKVEPQSPREVQPRVFGLPLRSSYGTGLVSLSQEGLDEGLKRSDGESWRPPLPTSEAGYSTTDSAPVLTSTFSLLSHPLLHVNSSFTTPDPHSSQSDHDLSTPTEKTAITARDTTAEVIEGIQEIIDEVNQADDQIASYALDHVHANEIILTHSSCPAVQRFLVKASAKRKFTVIHVEAYPINHKATRNTIIGRSNGESDVGTGTELFTKSLTAAGITVILVPDSAVFALMSRVNKVLLSANTVLANGDFLATAGSKAIAQAACFHLTDVVVLSAAYQLSPAYPFEPDVIMEDGNPDQVVMFDDGVLVDKIEIRSPLYDYVPATSVNLYVTNLGGHDRSYLFRMIQDHYRAEDCNLDSVQSFST